MKQTSQYSHLEIGMNCTKEFQIAYKNRYTWEETFKGYKGKCSYKSLNTFEEGTFCLDSDCKPNISHIKDQSISKSIGSQLFEVSIHRIRRSFDEVHNKNTFIVGSFDQTGMEVIVEGKCKGDSYSLKNNVITMVRRNIHGKLVEIFNLKTYDTGSGYLSTLYTSQYFCCESYKALTPKSLFHDTFSSLYQGGPWVLTTRKIEVLDQEKDELQFQIFNFYDISQLD